MNASTTNKNPAPQPRAYRSTWSMLAQIGFISVAAIAVYGFVAVAREDHQRSVCSAMCALAPNYAARDRVAPDFELPDMDGNLVRLSSFRGKTVILNFWTISCGPCRDEIPSFQELQATVRKRKDIVLLTVSTDDGPDAVRDRLKVMFDGDDHPFPILFDPDLKVVKEKYGTELFPETWLIDPHGVIRARFDRAIDWSRAIGLEAIETAGKLGRDCPVKFTGGLPVGEFAGLCATD